MGLQAHRSALHATAKIALGSLVLASCAGRSTALEESTVGAGAESGEPTGGAGHTTITGGSNSGGGTTPDGSGVSSGGVGGGETGGTSSAGSAGGGASSGAAGMAAGTAGSAGSGGELACAGSTTLGRPPVDPVPTQAEFECCLAFVRDGAASNWGAPEDGAPLPSEPYANCCPRPSASRRLRRLR